MDKKVTLNEANMSANTDKEQLLWAYIDGTCNPAEKATVEALLATDPEWQAEHALLLAIHRDLPEQLPVAAPSLRFTKNVMEAIGRHRIAPAMKTYINKKVVYGIAGFVGVLMVSLIVYLLAGTDFSSGTLDLKSIKSPIAFDFNIKWKPDSRVVNAFFIINAFLALFLVDRYLNQKKTKRHWSDAPGRPQ